MGRILLTILIGTLGGLIGGTLGIGASILTLPGILLLGIVKDYKTAIGTILLSILPPVTLLAVIEYFKENKIDTTISFILFITSFFATFIGSKLNKNLSEKTLEYSASFIFFLIASYYFYIARYGRL